MDLAPWEVDLVKDAAKVLLGAVIGLGAASWSDWNKRHKRVAETKAAIKTELSETAYRMVCAFYKLERVDLRGDRELLEWIAARVRMYSGPNPKDGLLASVDALLAATPEQLLAVRRELEHEGAPPVFIPRETVAYSAAVIANLHEFEPQYALAVLDILAHVRMFNDSADQSREYIKMTYGSGLSDGNHASILATIATLQAGAAQRAQIIIRKIERLESLS